MTDKLNYLAHMGSCRTLDNKKLHKLYRPSSTVVMGWKCNLYGGDTKCRWNFSIEICSKVSSWKSEEVTGG
jgi:hypothetical protein